MFLFGVLIVLMQVQEFVTGLVDHARTSYELEVILNHNPEGDPWQVHRGYFCRLINEYLYCSGW